MALPLWAHQKAFRMQVGQRLKKGAALLSQNTAAFAASVTHLVDVSPAVGAHVSLLDEVLRDGGASVVRRRLPLQQHRVPTHLLVLQRLRLRWRACGANVSNSINFVVFLCARRGFKNGFHKCLSGIASSFAGASPCPADLACHTCTCSLEGFYDVSLIDCLLHQRNLPCRCVSGLYSLTGSVGTTRSD